jgi:hypothetical protein
MTVPDLVEEISNMGCNCIVIAWSLHCILDRDTLARVGLPAVGQP